MAGSRRCARCASVAAACTRNDFGADAARRPGSAASPGLEDAAAAARSSRNGIAATTGSRGAGCSRMDFVDAVAAARERYGADRIAVVVGTSTSSIGASEEAYRAARCRTGAIPPDLRRPIIHTPHSLGDFVQHALGSTGHQRHGRDRVLVERQGVRAGGAADPHAASPMRPSSAASTRCAAACCSASTRWSWCRPSPAGRSTSRVAASISARRPASRCWSAKRRRGPWLLGYGESSDAHHMSSPHPEGRGARLALQDALERAQLAPADIDYINLHGTASQKNDEVEARRRRRDCFRPRTFASSTKGWTGHTLGAAGIVEAAISLLAIEHGVLPGTLNLADARSGLRAADPARQRRARAAQRAELLVRLRRQQLRARLRPERPA